MTTIRTTYKYKCDLDKGTLETSLRNSLMQADALADAFAVTVQRNGADVDISGMTVYGYLYANATQSTVPIKGTVSGSTATVILSEDCYAVPGYASLMIQLHDGDVRHTVLKVDFVVTRTGGTLVLDGDNVLPTLAELLGQISAMEQATAEAREAAAAADAAREGIQGDLATLTEEIEATAANFKVKNAELLDCYLYRGNMDAELTVNGAKIQVTAPGTTNESDWHYLLYGVNLGSNIEGMKVWVRNLVKPKNIRGSIRFGIGNSNFQWPQAPLDVQTVGPTVFDVEAIVSANATLATHSGNYFLICGFDTAITDNGDGTYTSADCVSSFEAAIEEGRPLFSIADEAVEAMTADRALTSYNALTGDKAVFSPLRSSMPSLGDSSIGGTRIAFAVGENNNDINVYTTGSLGKVAALRDKQFLIKCVNRNTDAETDNAVGWYLSHTNTTIQDWGNDIGNIGTLYTLTKERIIWRKINFTAYGYADDDDFYLRINNKGSYVAQTPYSLDIDILIYIVPDDYADNTGLVVATNLIDFNPEEYVKREELGLSGDYITCWGDSLTAQGGWTATLMSMSGMPVYNGGTGGEGSKTIMARQGADAMVVNNFIIPADTTPVQIATYAEGIPTALGNTVAPLLQGGAHVNPVMLGDIEGKLEWTGSSYNDTTGVWTFTRSTAGEAVTINRPTAMRTDFDRNKNAPHLMVIFMGTNDGNPPSDVETLVWRHKKMIEHAKAKNVIVLGISRGTPDAYAAYDAAMRKEFGRYFISLREYLAHPIYDTDGSTIVSCYGLDDAGLTATDADLAAIATGTVPPQLLSDGVHYTEATRTVIGKMLYKRCCELGIF